MESNSNILKSSSIGIVPNMTLNIPTVGEILDFESEYYNTISSLTSTPYQYMVQLDDMGIDYTSVSEWELFRMLFIGYCNQKISKIKEPEENINHLNHIQKEN